jgi:LysR family transcriptional activator of mexEF-oprN operon
MADLSTLDLNLLRVFDAVARERHVTRAAQRLHLSQPAVSNALTRLRAALNDELFLRRPGGVEPTELALSLAQPVAEVLDRLRETLASHAPFDPASSDRVFTTGFSEYAEAVLAPPLLAQPPSLYTRLRLLPEAFLVLMRPGHPLAEGEMTVERFSQWPHLLHSPNGSLDGALDQPMREAGFPRRLGAVVAHLSAVPAILMRTDMVMALSRRLARQMATAHGLELRPCPVETQHTRLSLIFHRRFEADQGHAWLRRLILSLARDATPADECDRVRQGIV